MKACPEVKSIMDSAEPRSKGMERIPVQYHGGDAGWFVVRDAIEVTPKGCRMQQFIMEKGQK